MPRPFASRWQPVIRLKLDLLKKMPAGVGRSAALDLEVLEGAALDLRGVDAGPAAPVLARPDDPQVADGYQFPPVQVEHDERAIGRLEDGVGAAAAQGDVVLGDLDCLVDLIGAGREDDLPAEGWHCPQCGDDRVGGEAVGLLGAVARHTWRLGGPGLADARGQPVAGDGERQRRGPGRQGQEPPPGKPHPQPLHHSTRVHHRAVAATAAGRERETVGRVGEHLGGHLLAEQHAVVLTSVVRVDVAHVRQPDVGERRSVRRQALAVANAHNWLGVRRREDVISRDPRPVEGRVDPAEVWYEAVQNLFRAQTEQFMVGR